MKRSQWTQFAVGSPLLDVPVPSFNEPVASSTSTPAVPNAKLPPLSPNALDLPAAQDANAEGTDTWRPGAGMVLFLVLGGLLAGKVLLP
jgi:hypothetical protein